MGLVDSDNEEDVPDMPDHLLSSIQRRRRKVRLEREMQRIREEARIEKANADFDRRCELRGLWTPLPELHASSPTPSPVVLPGLDYGASGGFC